MMDRLWKESRRSLSAFLYALEKHHLVEIHSRLFGTKGSSKSKDDLVLNIRTKLRALSNGS